MTILYSIYYEFSKRYPHSRITGMKQETICSKTELVLRMFNYTLGADTFRKGLQKFIVDREYKTFFTDDVWEALNKQAHLDEKISNMTIKSIATSWIQKDRLPTVTVKRDYDKKTAKLSQKVYLRERPHDVPEQDKMLWSIPIVIVTQDKLNFENTTPVAWMKKEREIEITNMPSRDKFIIINPEEIGPFPVNYDYENWNLIANYLQTKEGRQKIPVYTRAKLLHDAWNLAYAGKLSFATAFNMTLFMKSERDHLVWNPIFTMIDHIGRHIDMSNVHKKFEIYVGTLLTPLYEELGSEGEDNEENWKRNLRSLSKTFLCRAGYLPCIKNAQNEYKKWMESDDPDEGNPLVFKVIIIVFSFNIQIILGLQINIFVQYFVMGKWKSGNLV
jgi:aminopeptidase N